MSSLTEPCPTLRQLEQRVEDMIKRQGEDAPVAWWIYNKEDVLIFNPDNEVQHAPIEVCQQVLSNLQEYDHIYTAISDAIEQELKEVELTNEQELRAVERIKEAE